MSEPLLLETVVKDTVDRVEDGLRLIHRLVRTATDTEGDGS